MKHHLVTLLTTTALSLFPFVGIVSAQSESRQTATNPGEETIGLTDASIFDGKEVTDLDGNEIGEVEKLLVDARNGRIRYAVIEVDRDWNWDDPEIAVPFGAFKVDRIGADDVRLRLDTTKEKLANAPKFKEGDAHRLSDQTESNPIYTFWSIPWFNDPPASESEGREHETTTPAN